MKEIENAVRNLVSKIYEDVTDFSYTGSYEREIKELSESIEKFVEVEHERKTDELGQAIKKLVQFEIKNAFAEDRKRRFYLGLD